MQKTSPQLIAQVRAYLAAHNVATLATCADGRPWAAAVFYVCDGPVFYFLSSLTSRHVLQLARNSFVALTVQEDYAEWLEIKGVQIEGEVLEISGEEEAKARRLYGEKFPVVGMLAKAPPAIVKALAKARWYKVLPHRVFFLDNSKGLGHREELELSGWS
jgi:uncharacterized protein YhbP (UPF0306 family)